MLKKTVIGILILFVVLVLAAVALVTLVDVNRFKPQIESFVKSNYDRTLTIEGDLSLKLFPRLALVLPASSLTNPKAQTKALSLQSARVSVAVLPLIKGQVEAEKIQLNGLKASLIRFADGSTSIDDLIGQPAQAGDKAEQTPAGASALTGFRIGGIALTDATVTIKDELTKNSIDLTGLNLETGELRDNLSTPVKFSVDVQTSSPKLNAKVGLNGQVKFELSSGRYTVQTADLTVNGQLDGMPFSQTVNVTGLRGGANTLSADMISVTGRIEQPGRKVLAQLKSPVAFDPGRGLLTLRTIDGKIDLDDASVSPEPLSIPFSGDASIDTNAETVAANLKLSPPEAVVDARVGIKGFAKPRVSFDLSSGRINLDRYMPPAKEKNDASTSQAKPSGVGSATQADPVIDLTFLNNLDIDGKVDIGELIAQGLTVTRVKAAVKSAKGELNVAPISMNLYGGSMAGGATVRAKNNRFSLSSDLTGVNIGPLIKDLTQDDLIEGNGDVRIRLQSSGATVSAIKKALAGEARLALRDGAIMGINLGQKIRDAKSLLRTGGTKSEASAAGVKTDFAALTASFKIVDGIATNTDLSGKSPLIRLSGAGKIDIAAGSLDYTAQAAIVGTSKGQGGREAEELRGVTLPVRLTGPFEALNWKIDWGEAAKGALKSRAAQELSGKLEPKKAELKAKLDEKKAELETNKDQKVKELKEKAASKIGDQLKGLLGK